MPSSNTTNKRKSQSTAPTKQVLLGFASLKRTATGHVAGKIKVQRTNSAPVRANVAAVTESRSRSPDDPIEDSDSSSSLSADDIEEERVTEDDAISTPVTRRSARISGVAKTKAESKVIVADNGMFRSRNSLDSSPRKRPGLKKAADPGLSEAWRKHYGVARQKMGGLQPSELFGLFYSLYAHIFIDFVVHAENETAIHHILRVFDLYVILLYLFASHFHDYPSGRMNMDLVLVSRAYSVGNARTRWA